MSITWYVNGTGSANNDIIQLGIVTNGDGSQQSNLTIPGYSQYNNTVVRCNAFLYFYFLYFFILLLFFGCQIKQYLKSYLYYWRSFNYVTLFISIGIINPYKLLNT